MSSDRIRELAEESGMTQYVAAHNKYLERFAEMIVQECVAQIEPMWKQVQELGPPPGYDYDTFDLAYNDAMNAIKERFGVK